MEQLERTRRYLDRLRATYSGVLDAPQEREYTLDDAHSFFMHCHHVADWIADLNRVGVTREDVDSFVKTHKELRICADLSNGTKHCRLTRRTRTGHQPHIARRTFESGSTGGEPKVVKGKFKVLSNGEFHDALALAETCMGLWDSFVADLGNRAEQNRESGVGLR